MVARVNHKSTEVGLILGWLLTGEALYPNDRSVLIRLSPNDFESTVFWDCKWDASSFCGQKWQDAPNIGA